MCGDNEECLEKSVSTDVLYKAAVRLAILCGLMAEAQYKREENKAGGRKDENCDKNVANVVCLDSEYAVYWSAGVGIPKLALADRSPIRRPN